MVRKKFLEWLEQYLNNLNIILLWVFILSMISIAVVYMFTFNKLNYEVKDSSNIIDDYYLNQSSLPVITQEDYEEKKSFYKSIAWIGFISLFGWLAFNKNFHAALVKLWDEESFLK